MSRRSGVSADRARHEILITLSFQALDGPRLPHALPRADAALRKRISSRCSRPRALPQSCRHDDGRGRSATSRDEAAKRPTWRTSGPGQVPESIADADDVQQRQARRGEILAADFAPGEPLLLQQDDRPAQACEQQGDRAPPGPAPITRTSALSSIKPRFRPGRSVRHLVNPAPLHRTYSVKHSGQSFRYVGSP